MSNNRERSGTGGSLVQSVDRAVSVLELLALQGEAGVTEMAAELGVHKSTAFRLVSALELRGLVEQSAERGKYRLGFGIVRLAGATVGQLDLTQQGRAVCETLAAELGETVNLAVADGGVAINVDQVWGSASVMSHNWIGRSTPLHATSSGKVLLAYMKADTRDEALAAPLESFTEYTIVGHEQLRQNLKEVYEIGVSYSMEEFEVGLNAVAAAIHSYEGAIVAALSASGPSYRLTEDRMEDVGQSVLNAAGEISTRMGYISTPGHPTGWATSPADAP